jgi:glycosyltransferase involved in cell wall biosynthesis
MISIIICSRDKQILSQVGKSVEATIGCAFEIIAVDNSQNKYGICEAYNVGASQAKYDYLCFMHEDLAFHTQDWGNIVANILQQPGAGVLGVAGGIHQVKAPAGWGGNGRIGFAGVNVIHTKNGKSQHDYANPQGKVPLIPAATLDGLWLCCLKSVWEEFKFDSKTFPGFHFYDIDFCTRVATKYQNYITFEVLIEHFSHGTFDKIWMESALHFYKNRKAYLPFGPLYFTKTELHALNLLAMQKFTLNSIEYKLPKQHILYCLKECFKLSPLNRDNFYLAKRALLEAK